MRQSAEYFIAVRYLVARRRQVFISTITAICITGIAAGVWLIITVLSVMNGFERTWREEIIGNRAHFTVHSGFGPFADYESVLSVVSQSPGVTAVSPYLDAEGMVRSRQGDIFAVRLRGVDPERVGRVTDLRDDMQVGSLDGLMPRPADSNGHQASPSGIVIGSQLAAAVGAAVGDPLLLISPYGGAPTPLGPAPRLKRFEVVGIFQSSFFQYDEVYTYTSLAAAQDFRKAGDVVDGLEARTTDLYRSRRVANEVVRMLEYPFYSRDWKEYFPAFFQALKTERVMMFILLSIVMVVAAFVIVATLIMMIMEKSSDIAILKAMGAEDSSIERIFALEGTLIGLAGTVAGVLAGVAVTHQLPWIQQMIERITGIDTLPPEIYQFSTLPSEMNPVDVVVIATIAMVLSLGATLLPSRQGARVDPVEGLRHE
jgi:lipoprotein-releasing system permease protein